MNCPKCGGDHIGSPRDYCPINDGPLPKIEKPKPWVLYGLDPCPFCGSEKVTISIVRDGYKACCLNCHASGAPAFHGRLDQPNSQTRAIKSWNDRALLRPSDGWNRDMSKAPRDRCILVAGGSVHARDDSVFPYEGPCTTASIVYWYQDHWRGDNLEGHDNWFEHRPIAWMPLPAPPSPEAGHE